MVPWRWFERRQIARPPERSFGVRQAPSFKGVRATPVICHPALKHCVKSFHERIDWFDIAWATLVRIHLGLGRIAEGAIRQRQLVLQLRALAVNRQSLFESVHGC